MRELELTLIIATYGELKGKVSYVAADAKQRDQNILFFPVKIKLNGESNSKVTDLQLVPGMSVQANLKLRDKPVISLISDLFTQQTDSIRSLRSN